MRPSLRITISNYVFQVSAPYSPGPVTLTDGEARVLNTIRAVNIRNRMASKVRQALESTPDGILSPSTISNLQSQISSLDSTFQFPSRQRSPKQTVLDVEIEIVASEFADRAARESGSPDEMFSLSATPEQIEEWKKRPEVQAEALRRIMEQREVLETEEL